MSQVFVIPDTHKNLDSGKMRFAWILRVFSREKPVDVSRFARRPSGTPEPRAFTLTSLQDGLEVFRGRFGQYLQRDKGNRYPGDRLIPGHSVVRVCYTVTTIPRFTKPTATGTAVAAAR